MFGQETLKDTIQPKRQNLEEVIISATRKRQFSSIPLPAILIGEEKLKTLGQLN